MIGKKRLLVNVHGRLANQMFIVSALLKKYNNPILLFRIVPINEEFQEILRNSGIIFKTYEEGDYFDECIDDFFQDASLHDEKMIQEIFKLPESTRKYDFVIHVRREDYLNYPNLYRTLTKEYIEEMYRKYYKGGSVGIVSTEDGLKWAEEQNFSFKYEPVNDTPMKSIATIAKAKTVICSGSSFSVMGCMLNKNEDKVCVIQTPYDLMTDEHDKIIPDYFKKEQQ